MFWRQHCATSWPAILSGPYIRCSWGSIEGHGGQGKEETTAEGFRSALREPQLRELKILFDTYDVNARGGVFKQTTLAFHNCPDELARWLVERGADLAAGDRYGDTPLHSRARHWKGRIEVLLELGADVNHGENDRGTPLHAAAGSCNAVAAGLLLQHGARVDALNRERHTPLAYALQGCGNVQIEGMAALAEATSAALDKLYVLFGAPPVPRRLLHDGRSPIVARSARWED